MDWLRPCYASTFRLFRERPDVLTKGRYYFAAPGTPHYPGFHIYGSATWTQDAENPPEAPLLGEDRSRYLGYSSGILGVPQPPAVTIGSEDCVTNGEAFPPEVIGRGLVLGVDSACWTRAGLPVPNAPAELPWIWHRPESLAAAGDGVPLAKWPNEGLLTTPLRQPAPSIRPTVYHTGIAHLPVVEFSQLQRLDWRPIAPPTDEATVFLVGTMEQAGRGSTPHGPSLMGDIPLNGSQPGSRQFRLVWTNGDYFFETPDGVDVGAAVLWIASVRPGLVHLESTEGAGGTDFPGPLRPITYNGIITSPVGSISDRLCRVVELMIYNRYLTAAEITRTRDYLHVKYGL